MPKDSKQTREERKRYAGLILAAAGVAALFLVMIGTGYRVTQTPGSPIGDVVYFAAIGVLVVLVAVAVRHWWFQPQTLAADAVRRLYVEPIEPGESPSHLDMSTDRLSELRHRIEALALVIDAPTGLLPSFQQPEHNARPDIEIDGDTYHYVIMERGQELERYSTTSLDDLLYRVFRDVAFSMSSKLARPHQRPGDDCRREMFRQQLMLLDGLKPEWAARCAVEHREVLANHPFVDER